MKTLVLATIATSALVLAGCEARVSSNGVQTNVNSEALDNAGAAIDNTFEDLENAAARTGDAIENGFDRTMNDLSDERRDTERAVDNATDGDRTDR